MNHDDRQLIADLFDRMHSVQGLNKDADAEALIHQSMRNNADSPYLLVQSVLAQEVALQEAGRRIEDLEAQVAGGRNGTRANAVPAGQPAPWEAAPAQSAAGKQPSSSPGIWGAPLGGASSASTTARSSGVPMTSRSSSGSTSRPGRPSPGGTSGQQAGPAQAARSGGGFLGQAMTTAAGVAGGMLLASSIGSLFGGGQTASASSAATPATAEATPASDAQANAEADAQTDAEFDNASAEDQGGFQDASFEDDAGGDWGTDDFGGGDFEL